MQDRDDLLALHDEEQKGEENLSFKTLLTVYLAIAVALALFLPKIYITNQIYYLSRDIADLSGKRDVLFEENRELSLKLEKMRYKNQILDPLHLK
ncbi:MULTISPECIES: hypothetical protein [unclassified Campylobacter]|uniref:hypothetical protein n=1 Tax=Campylobacter TaxID=194 RepID=UPI0014740A21|nr:MULTISPECIES: hypothetical protein [unclassified Campylobacter]QKF92056.1 hypothetical protein CORI_0855 [Campylobacter sp. CCUG 57310]